MVINAIIVLKTLLLIFKMALLDAVAITWMLWARIPFLIKLQSVALQV